MASGDGREELDEHSVRSSGLGSEPRDGVAEVRLVEAGALVDAAGEEPFAEGTEGDETDAQLLEDSENLVLGLAPPQRVLALEGGNGLDSMGTANGRHAGFREPEEADLALTDELVHRTSDVFDRHLRVDRCW